MAATAAASNVHQMTPVKPYPEFEGHTIEYVVTIVKGTVKIPEDHVLHLDDRIRVISEWRVVAVQIKMDKAGKWYREQVISIFDAPGASTTAIVPWNPADSTDNGIVHSATCPGVTP
jgi:hypothetical protein